MGEPATRGARPGRRAARLSLLRRLPAATADAYAGAGFTAVVQDVLPGEDLTACTGLIRTRHLDAELRRRTPRIGLWLDTSRWTPEQAVAAILAGAQRARVA